MALKKIGNPSINWFRGKSKLVREIFGLEYIDVVHKYIEKNKTSEGVRVSLFNPLIDMCFKCGLLREEDVGLYSTIYPMTMFNKTGHKIFKDPRGSLGLFMESCANDIIPFYGYEISLPSIIYSDSVSIMMINGVFEEWLIKNKKSIRSILDNKYSLGALKRSTE